MISCDGSSAVVELEVFGFYEEEFVNEHGAFVKLGLPGGATGRDLGWPSVPTVHHRIAIPAAADVRVRIVENETVVLTDYNLFPVQPAEVDRPLEKPIPFIKDEQAYRLDGLYPVTAAKTGRPEIMRDVRFVDLAFHPLRINTARQQLTISTRMVVELLFTPGSTDNVLLRDPFAMTPSIEKLYRAAFLNFDSLKLPRPDVSTPQLKYLVITTEALSSAVQPLVSWYNQSGLNTQLVTTSETGTTYTAIKAYIQNVYNQYGIEYVLLAGDISLIPIGNWSSYPSDHLYCLLAGSDDTADIALGRFSVTQPAMMQHQIQKTLNYVHEIPQDDWTIRSILIAHQEEYPGKYTQCKNQIRTFDYDVVDPIFDTAYPPEGGTRPQVATAINNGRGIVNYRGHGLETEWSWSPGWYNADCYALNNGLYLPHVFNICCENGHLDYSAEVLGEAWMNAGSNGQGGAVTSLCATRSSYTIANHLFDKGLYWGAFDDGVPDIGYILNVGKVHQATEGEYGIINNYMYVLLGDPALDVFTDAPAPLTVEHAPTAPMGPNTFAVNVQRGGAPVADAMVCCWKGLEVWEVGYTDWTGHIEIPINPITTGEMTLTVTAQNGVPYVGTVNILVTGCGAMQMNSNTYNCTALVNISLWDADLDLNPLAIDTAQVDISSTTDPLPELVTLTESAPDSGRFDGQIQLDPVQGGLGFLMVSDNDTITLTYEDADCDGAPATVTAQASTDCAGPGIANILVTGLSDSAATINWTTDERSNSTIIYGPGFPPIYEANDPRLTLEHSVTITGLESCRIIFYEVHSTDAYGNVTIENNGGTYFQFTTLGKGYPLQEPMNLNPNWTISGGQWAWGQPAGSSGDPTSGYTGNNVYGYNLNGAYPNSMPEYTLTTPAIDCSEGSNVHLAFFGWLGVESNYYDHARVRVSNNGTSWTQLWENGSSSMSGGSWSEYDFDISAIADGQPAVYIRWTMGPTDGSVTYCGWNIDDVTVYYDYVCGTPLPTATPENTPTPTISPTPTLTPTLTPTETPTLTPSPTVTPTPVPTETPLPTDTPLPTETPVPTDTPPPATSTPTPTEPPDPTETPFPTSTPIPGDPEIDLVINQEMFRAGDQFLLTCRTSNPGPAIELEQYILLDVWGSYYFWPTWTEDLDFVFRSFPRGFDETETILEFSWPEGAGSAQDIRFWAAYLLPQTAELSGNYDMLTFGFE